MRVLYCTDTYPPQVNGVSLVTALSVGGLQARGWECGVVAPRYPDTTRNVFSDAREHGGTEDMHVAVPSISFVAYPDVRLTAPAYGRVARAVREFQPDLIHCETEFMIGRVGQSAGIRAGIPVVSSYHTDFARYTTEYGISWLRGSVERYIMRFHCRSRRTYTPSVPYSEELRQAGVRDVEVWGRSVDTKTYTPACRNDALRTRLELGNRFVLLYVGRLAFEKRVDQIIAAFAAALPLLPPDSARLVLAGAGPRGAELQAKAPPGVHFLGYLDRTRELPELYATADAFVFASLTETLGLVVLEAMASGLPVIASPSGGVADHLRDGVNGLAYPACNVEAMRDAIVRLARDPALRQKLSRGARATAEALPWDRELDRLDASYREVCAGAAAERAA